MMLLVLLGVLIGLIMGLTGAGGGILAVPALVLALGWSVTQASPVALLAVAMSAALGVWGAWPQRLVRYRAATLMALVGIPFTSLGLLASQLLTARQLAFIFVALMLYIGIRQWRHRNVERVTMTGLAASGPYCRIDQKTGRIIWTWPSAFIIGGIGAITGFCTGLLGVGGGFIMVPLLRRVSQVSTQGIVATSLMVIALVASGGFVTAILHGRPFPIEVALPFTLSACAGMFASRKLAPRIPALYVRSGFALLVLAVGASVAIHAWLYK